MKHELTSIWNLNSLEREEMLKDPDYEPERPDDMDNEDYIEPAKFYVENL